MLVDFCKAIIGFDDINVFGNSGQTTCVRILRSR